MNMRYVSRISCTGLFKAGNTGNTGNTRFSIKKRKNPVLICKKRLLGIRFRRLFRFCIPAQGVTGYRD